MRPDMNFLHRFGLKAAAEAMITKGLRYDPQRLEELRQHRGSDSYPWQSKDENRIFWEVYEEMAREPFIRERLEGKKPRNGDPGYARAG